MRKNFTKKGFKKRESGSERSGVKKSFGKKKEFGKKKFGSETKEEGFGEKKNFAKKREFGKKKFGSEVKEENFREKRKTFGKKSFGGGFGEKKEFGNRKYFGKGDSYDKKKYVKKSYPDKIQSFEEKPKSDETRLNKYISNAGICSRREADDLIAAGTVSVNGKIITEMGFKVKVGDVVNYGGQTLRQEKMRYVLLNKPKDYITTMNDPEGRKNVMELVRNACSERIYPVGRLDRTTTGVLLFTNDGELTKQLTHPRYGIKKVYHVTLDQNLKHNDFEKIKEGIELEDGFIKPDAIEYSASGTSKNEIGIEVHSGRNRIVRRIFEQFGYKVLKLDRILFAGLTKKALERGMWRHLTEKEVGFLKMTPA